MGGPGGAGAELGGSEGVVSCFSDHGPGRRPSRGLDLWPRLRFDEGKTPSCCTFKRIPKRTGHGIEIVGAGWWIFFVLNISRIGLTGHFAYSVQ